MNEETAKPQLHDQVFNAVNSGINRLCQEIQVTGTNGKLPYFLKRLVKVYRDYNVNQEVYIQDVRIRTSLAKVSNKSF